MSNEKASLPAKNRSRSTEAPPTLEQETAQTGERHGPSGGELGPWRSSLDVSKRLTSDLDRLVLIRTGLAGESASLNIEIVKVCDAGIAEPAKRAELAVELSRLCARQVVLERELASVNRALDKTIAELQKNLLDGSYGWSGLAKAHQDAVLASQVEQLLSGVQTPNLQMQEGAAALAKGDPAVVDATKFSGIISLSFAWTQQVTEKTRESVLENIRNVAQTHQRLAGELLPLCATLTSLPPFEEPVAPPPETHPEWNLALGAEITVSDRMIEMSGKRKEDLTPADLDILARAEAGNNSYLKEIKNPADRIAVGSTL